MNANDNLDRGIADVYEREAPQRAPDWVLAGALDTIESTPQRRVLIRVPWRLPVMNTFAKVAVAAVAVLALGLVGLNLLSQRSSSGVGGQTTASPSPTTSPSGSPSTSAPPTLSETFTSTIHGISIDYPGAWSAAPATKPWSGTNELSFESVDVDHLYDPALRDHLFMATASHALDGKAGATWVEAFLDAPEEGCGTTPREPITVDGATGQICGALAAFSVEDRGYYVRLYTSDDEAWLGDVYDDAWFRTVLDTVKLDPARAVDASPSA